MTSTIMILGANGQMGQALAALPPHQWPREWSAFPVTRAQCDITHASSLRDVMQRVRPALVMNCAAMTAVDACEKDMDAARIINFEAVAQLAAHCSALDIPLIHLSTDYVFDGTATTPYTPDSPTCPINLYGESKWLGEEAIRHTHPWHIILRISSVFSEYGSNILTRTLDALKRGDTIRSVTDQVSCPTYAPAIAEAMVALGQSILSGRFNGFGTFHFCGDEAINRLTFTQYIREIALRSIPDLPEPVAALTSDFPGFAPRPAYAAMDCEKIIRTYGLMPPSWRQGVDQAVTRLLSQAQT